MGWAAACGVRVRLLFGVVLGLAASGLAERPLVSISALGLEKKHAIVRPEVTHYLAPGVRSLLPYSIAAASVCCNCWD